MSKEKKSTKEAKKAPATDLKKKASAYQNDKNSTSSVDSAVGKKNKSK